MRMPWSRKSTNLKLPPASVADAASAALAIPVPTDGETGVIH